MTKGKRVRVRFAPSPTGNFHIGGLRTAFYNYLFARHYKGDFILRIEDTDQSRLVAGAVQQLLRIVNEFQITPDEGPQLTKEGTIEEYGSYGPYTQSKRNERYREIAQKLSASGHAYYCFCTQERLDQLRSIQQKKKLPPKYDGLCRTLPAEDIAQRKARGDAHVLRLKMPKTGTISVHDLVRGKVDFSYALTDDQVLVKSDGFPTYHLANVVDDHDMKITHVIRGEEWLPSVPKHLFLYNALRWDPPLMAHLPILLDERGGKLSKRSGSASVDDFISKGFVPDALLNFILLLGWNPKNNQEIFTRDEMIHLFTLDHVNASGAAVNTKKLIWINRAYIAQMSAQDLHRYAIKHNFLSSEISEKVENSSAWMEFLSLVKSRLDTLQELQASVDYYLNDPVIDKKLLNAKSDITLTRKILQEVHTTFTSLASWNGDAIKKSLESMLIKKGWKRGEVLWPIRVALTGKKFSPGTYELLQIFDKSVVLRRITSALNA